jgi:hypothetical protein
VSEERLVLRGGLLVLLVYIVVVSAPAPEWIEINFTGGYPVPGYIEIMSG